MTSSSHRVAGASNNLVGFLGVILRPKGSGVHPLSGGAYCCFAPLRISASLRETSRHARRKAIFRFRAKTPSPAKTQSTCWRPLATFSLPPHRPNHELDFTRRLSLCRAKETTNGVRTRCLLEVCPVKTEIYVCGCDQLEKIIDPFFA